MKSSIYLLLLFSLLSGCQTQSAEKASLSERTYGLWKEEDRDRAVRVDLERFEDMVSILSHCQTILCQDSIPVVELPDEHGPRYLFLDGPCDTKHGVIDYWDNNILWIRNDSVVKTGAFEGPLDSLQPLLTRDLINYGNHPDFSDAPDKLFVWVYMDNPRGHRLESRLARLLDAYAAISDTTDVPVMLSAYPNW